MLINQPLAIKEEVIALCDDFQEDVVSRALNFKQKDTHYFC